MTFPCSSHSFLSFTTKCPHGVVSSSRFCCLLILSLIRPHLATVKIAKTKTNGCHVVEFYRHVFVLILPNLPAAPTASYSPTSKPHFLAYHDHSLSVPPTASPQSPLEMLLCPRAILKPLCPWLLLQASALLPLHTS